MGIDLDELFSGDAKEQTPVAPQPTAPVDPSMSMELAVATPAEVETPFATRSKKVATPAAKASSLAEIYDRYLKRIYLFDVSGSMNEPVVGDETLDMFEWDKGASYAWENLRERINAATMRVQTFQTLLAAAVIEGHDIPEYQMPTESDAIWASAPEYTGDAEVDKPKLQEWVIEKGLVLDAGFRPKIGLKLTTRMQLVSTVALELIRKRFDKYPDAEILAYAFQYQATELPCSTKEELLQAIEQLPTMVGGGTDIAAAFETAFDQIRAKPSAMQVNHIIVVTDAEASCREYVLEKAIPKAKKLNTTVDFIHIAKPGGEMYDSDTVNALKDLCAQTKGEYTKVTTKKEIESKFLAASTRLMLPPGA